jgi:hypothetical protein
VSIARPNLNPGEARGLDTFIIEFHDISAMKNDVYGRYDKIYHKTDTGDAFPIL